MDVVDGNCVLCTKNTDVLNNTFCNQFRALLKTHYFNVNDEDFKQFSKLFDSRSKVHSFCVPCTLKLSCYFETRNACSQANTPGTGRTCSLCNNTDYVTKCSKQLKDDFENVFKGIEREISNLNYACLRCLLSINSFKDIKESITNLLNPENCDNSGSDFENMKKSKSPKISSPLAMRKRKNSYDNKNKSSKRFKPDKNRKSFEASKKSPKFRSKALEKKLKHLNNVNAETIERDMNLSYQVVTDQKLMFDIPFVNCNSIETESPKPIGKITRHKAKKIKLSQIEANVVIDVSSEDENEENTESPRMKRIAARKTKVTSNVKKSSRLQRNSSGTDSETTTPSSRPKRGVAQKTVTPPPKKQANAKKVRVIESSSDEAPTKSPRTSGRTIKASVIKPVFKTPKIKFKVPIKLKKVEKPRYPCEKCTRILKMKYMMILHELEHGSSYSPMISVEKRDLLALKEHLKLMSKSDEKEGAEITSELETDEKTDTEKKVDDVDVEQDENPKSPSLNLDKEKDTTEETDKEDVPAEVAVEESNEKSDEESDKMDVSTEKDAVETDKETEETAESNDKLDKNVDLKSNEENSSSDEEKITDPPEMDKKNTDITEETSKDEEDAEVESSKDEINDATDETNDAIDDTTDEAPIQESEKNDEVEKSEEDCSEKEATSPKRKSKTPSPKKSDKGESPKKQDVEQEKEQDNGTTIELYDSSDNDETTSKVAKSPEINGSNCEETELVAEKVKSPKKTDKTASPKKQKDSKENDDETNEQEKDTIEIDDDEAKKDVKSPKRSSKSPSPKRAKSASPKKVAETPENKDDDSEEQITITDTTEEVKETSVETEKGESEKEESENEETEKEEPEKEETEKEETAKDIPKEDDKNLSPISSDNESNTEPNDNASKGSDLSDNENERSENKKQKSNGFVDNEFEEFTLKLSSSEESNSPDKKNTSNQENESTNNIIVEESTNSVCKTSDQDPFQIVENILQNLGA